MATEKTYEIRTVADFLEVPIEKLTMCLEDFTTWCAIAHEVAAHNRDLEGATVVMKTDVFRWIDDDKHDRHLTVTMGRETNVAVPESSNG